MSLLDDILAHPDDDAPRLVYADHLLEQGDPRGELIAVQVSRGRLEHDGQTLTSAYRAVRRRERELLSVMPQLDGEYERGFLTRLTRSTMFELRAFSPRLGKEPLEAVTINDVRLVNELHWLAQQPWSARLREVSIANHDGVITMDARAMFDALDGSENGSVWLPEHGLPHPALKEAVIGVVYSRPTARTIDDLVRARNLKRFAVLNGLRYTGAAFDSFRKSAIYARLEEIALWKVEVAEAYSALVRASPKKLVLTLDDDCVFNRDVLDFDCARVESLHISLNATEDVLARLAERAPRLTDLRIQCLGAPSFDLLADQLSSLEITSTGFPSVRPIAETAFTRLTSLALGNFDIDAPLNLLETIAELRLFGCEIADPAALRAQFPDVRIE
jgi:uncharacterized protein (TIGR02996 family)